MKKLKLKYGEMIIFPATIGRDARFRACREDYGIMKEFSSYIRARQYLEASELYSLYF